MTSADARVIHAEAGELELDPHRVRAALGRPVHTQTSLTPVLDDLVHTSLREALPLIRPVMTWREAPIDATNEAAVVVSAGKEQVRLRVGSRILPQLDGAASAAVFVTTIGAALEDCARDRMRHDPLAGFVLDTIASLAAEATAELIHRRVAADATQRGLHVTNRFSPGYCSWHTSGQAELFTCFAGISLPVTLSASHLMQPTKSVSGLIGIGAAAQWREYPCAECDSDLCRGRLGHADDLVRFPRPPC